MQLRPFDLASLFLAALPASALILAARGVSEPTEGTAGRTPTAASSTIVSSTLMPAWPRSAL